MHGKKINTKPTRLALSTRQMHVKLPQPNFLVLKKLCLITFVANVILRTDQYYMALLFLYDRFVILRRHRRIFIFDIRMQCFLVIEKRRKKCFDTCLCVSRPQSTFQKLMKQNCVEAFLYARFSVWVFGAWMNSGITVCSHYSCFTCWSQQRQKVA